MNVTELVQAFHEIVLAEVVTPAKVDSLAALADVCNRPLTAAQLERIGRRAEPLFHCQHDQTDYDPLGNWEFCRDCGAPLPCENPQDSGFAALEQERKR